MCWVQICLKCTHLCCHWRSRPRASHSPPVTAHLHTAQQISREVGWGGRRLFFTQHMTDTHVTHGALCNASLVGVSVCVGCSCAWGELTRVGVKKNNRVHLRGYLPEDRSLGRCPGGYPLSFARRSGSWKQ